MFVTLREAARQMIEAGRGGSLVRRWGAPEDVGGVAVYLASAASRYHTGDVLRIDGGYLKF